MKARRTLAKDHAKQNANSLDFAHMEEVFTIIALHSTSLVVCNAMAVSQLWCARAKSESLWKAFCHKEFPSVMALEKLIQNTLDYRAFYRSRMQEVPSMAVHDCDCSKYVLLVEMDHAQHVNPPSVGKVARRLRQKTKKVQRDWRNIGSGAVRLDDVKVFDRDPTNTFEGGNLMEIPVPVQWKANSNVEFQSQFRLRISVLRTTDNKTAMLMDSGSDVCETIHCDGWQEPDCVWWIQRLSEWDFSDDLDVQGPRVNVNICASVQGRAENDAGERLDNVQDWKGKIFNMFLDCFYVGFEIFEHDADVPDKRWKPGHDSFDQFFALANVQWH